MDSANFLQFAVTAQSTQMRLQDFPRLLTRSFSIYSPDLPQAILCSYWASFYAGHWPLHTALYAISVRPARDLPSPFFRFCLTTDTLGLGCTLLTAGWIWYFRPLEHTITGRARISGFCHKRSRTRCFKFRGSRFQSHDSACWTSRYHQ